MSDLAAIVVAYLSSHQVPVEGLPSLITAVRSALGQRTVPPVEQTVFPDHLVCLEDGAKVTLLKRHLKKHFDMSPEVYLEKWGLPGDYPFVASDYSKRRSEIARETGLGRRTA